MSKNRFIIPAVVAVLLLSLGACKRIHFTVSEEVNDNRSNRFVIKEAWYQMGKSIALTGGQYQIVPGDSIILYIRGMGTVTGVGEAGVATLDFPQTTRFYIMLPNRLSLRRYDIGRRAICEITGSMAYDQGENLFVCQTGQVVIDSLKGEKLHGQFSGIYLNTRNQSITVDGPFKAGTR